MNALVVNQINKEQYDSLAYNMLLNIEESGEEKLRVYTDGKGIATIGVGFD